MKYGRIAVKTVNPSKFPALRYWRDPLAIVRDDLLQPKPQCSLSVHVEGKQTNVLYQKSGLADGTKPKVIQQYEMSPRIQNDASEHYQTKVSSDLAKWQKRLNNEQILVSKYVAESIN